MIEGVKKVLEKICNSIIDSLEYVKKIFKTFNSIKEFLDEQKKDQNGNYTLFDKTIDDERHKVLTNFTTCDIQAYPGTGKTSILNCKIKLLQEYWNLKDSGVLVLSHTNVAKDQIGKTDYPHYVDTIHGFINRFLGFPYIRSKGWNVKAVDDDLAIIKFGKAFANKLPLINESEKKKSISYFVRKGSIGKDCILDCYCGNSNVFVKKLEDTFDKDRSLEQLKNKNKNFANWVRFKDKNFENWVRWKMENHIFKEGYFSHDCLLHFALKLITDQPELINIIRKKFPVVLIDEAQDNSKLQNELLYKIFIEGSNPSIVQRYGDVNQKIYSGKVYEEWHFGKDGNNSLSIEKSYRCKSNIAKFASKFIIDNYQDNQPNLFPNLKKPKEFMGVEDGGLYDGITTGEGRNRVNIEDVLKEFCKKVAEYKRNKWGNEEEFKAVAIGKDGKEEEENKHRIPSYYPDFKRSVNQPTYTPKGVNQSLDYARSIVHSSGNFNKAYKVLIDMIRKNQKEGTYLKNNEARDKFNTVKESDKFILYKFLIGEKVKEEELKSILESWGIIDKKIAEDKEEKKKNKSKKAYNHKPKKNEDESNKVNVFLCKDTNIEVEIKTINAVKGETYNAVLVMDTFTHHYTLKNVIKYQCGKEELKNQNKKEVQTILETYFVAFSRATDLLILATGEDFDLQKLIG